MKRGLILGLGALIVLASLASAAHAQAPATPNTAGPSFVDADGDGICDNFQNGARAGNGAGQGKGKGYGRGKGDGTRVGPQDGTGFGPGPGAGGGTCDGTGPKGKGRGPRR